MPRGELQQRLGRNLRAHRQTLGLSQEALADRLDYHRTYIGSIEQGKRNPSLQALEELAGRLGVDPLDLLADDGG